MAIVGSVALWREAQKAMTDTTHRRSRRVTLAWLLLLAGSIACVAALTRPSVNASIRRRRVALVLLPSAELGRDKGIKAMQLAARNLLGRLDARDVVRIIMPRETGVTFKGDMAVEQAQRAVSSIAPLSIAAGDLLPVNVPKDVQHAYRFVAAGGSADAGPTVGVVEIPHALPGVTIDAVGAEENAAGRIEIFLALRNQSDRAWTGTIRCRGLNVPDKPDAPAREAWKWPGGEYREVVMRNPRQEMVFEVKSSDVLVIDAVSSAVDVATQGALPDASAYLVRRPMRRTKVAITNKADQADEMLGRFVRSDPTLELVDVGDPEVGIVIANGTDPLGDKAAIVINPPTLPAGCEPAAEVEAADLTAADVKADHPVMRNVSLAGVRVARLAPWKFGKNDLQEVLVWYKGSAVVIKQRVKPVTFGPPRLYLAFSLAPENTAFGMTKAGVIFLANSVRDLVPDATGKATFEYVSPVSVGPAGGRTLLVPAPGTDGKATDSAPYPWPGAYRYDDGKVHAVNIVGLRPVAVKVAPASAVLDLKLPDPQRDTMGVELWPALLAGGVLFWLAAWWAKLR